MARFTSFLTETGTGHGSRLGHITVRAWIILIVVLVACFNSTILVGLQVYCVVQGIEVPPLQMDRVLENMVFALIGFYFPRQQPPLPQQPSTVGPVTPTEKET